MSFPLHWFLKPVGRKNTVSNRSDKIPHAVTLEATPPTSDIFVRIISGMNMTRTVSAIHSRCSRSKRKDLPRSCVIAVLFAFSVQPNCAWAQYSPDASVDLGIGFGQMALGQSAISGTRRIGIESERAFQEDKKGRQSPQ